METNNENEKEFDVPMDALSIANNVFKIHNAAMIQMLNNSIRVAQNKHEKKAYQNVINYIRKQEKERVETMDKALTENASKIIQPENKLVVVQK